MLRLQVQRLLYFAFPQIARRQKLNYPQIKIIWPSKQIYKAGIQKFTLDNTLVKIYSPEKTITDCFKYRSKIGMEVAVDAIQRYFDQPAAEQNLNKLMSCAKLNRVDKVITPYVLALL